MLRRDDTNDEVQTKECEDDVESVEQIRANADVLAESEAQSETKSERECAAHADMTRQANKPFFLLRTALTPAVKLFIPLP